MLVSFQLASKFPHALVGLLDNLEQLASDPSCFEVLVKVDSEDPDMQAVLAAEAPRRKFRLRPLVTPRGRGYEDLWQALNELFQLTDPAAYFVCNINDEVRIKGAGWDDRLRRYVGLFPDHIFRLRTSRLKFRNYYDFWECGFAPENYAFFTKRWLDICGDWNPCFGPDSSQQYIAYYLGYATYPGIKQYNRDVPILDVGWDNEGVGRNLSPSAQRRRTAINFRLWHRQVSHPMQQELYRRARLLQAHIIQAECASLCKIDIVDDRRRRMILLFDQNGGALLDLLPYKLSRVGIFLGNVRRSARYTFFAGGGRDARNLMPISIIEYLVLRYPRLQRCTESISPSSRYRPLLPIRTIEYLALLARSISPPSSWYRSCRDRLTARYFTVRRSARRLVLRCRVSARRLERKNAVGRALIAVLRPPVVAVVWLFAGVGAAVGGLLRGLRTLIETAKLGASAFERSQGTERQGRGLLGSLKWWTRRTALLVVRIVLAGTNRILGLLSTSVWRRRGNRVSLALMDRDRRWLRIEDINRKKIAPSRDPWFNAGGEIVGTNLLEARTPASIDRGLNIGDKNSDRPRSAGNGTQARPFEDERPSGPGRTGAPA
jgi:hypothetical protein